MKLDEFDFHVPEELIAQVPSERRDASRMLVLHRKSGRIEHRRFADLPEYVRPGDTLVVNRSKVMKARLIGTRPTGGKVEAFLLRQVGIARFECLVKLTAGQKEGVEFEVAPGFTGKILKNLDGSMLYEVEFNCREGSLEAAIEKFGRVPLPPYIKREPRSEDVTRYQTVYAKEVGSIAAPTAGLHFTDQMFQRLRDLGADVEELVLHVGLGTFQPIKCESIEEHRMHRESFQVPEVLKGEALRRRRQSGRVIAVGTTVVRALESAARGMEDSTELFLRPGSEFLAIDALFTNFHQPKSSLIVMLSAFVGDRSLLLGAYAEAVRERYRFFSYGDCMLVL